MGRTSVYKGYHQTNECQGQPTRKDRAWLQSPGQPGSTWEWEPGHVYNLTQEKELGMVEGNTNKASHTVGTSYGKNASEARHCHLPPNKVSSKTKAWPSIASQQTCSCTVPQPANPMPTCVARDHTIPLWSIQENASKINQLMTKLRGKILPSSGQFLCKPKPKFTFLT